jgi:hypothetical protein
MSPSSNTVSSLARGEKWQIVLLTDMQVGKATTLYLLLRILVHITGLPSHQQNKTS